MQGRFFKKVKGWGTGQCTDPSLFSIVLARYLTNTDLYLLYSSKVLRRNNVEP
jgi:hypothetical protein